MSIIKKLVHHATLRALKKLSDNENYRFLRSNYLFQELSAEAYLFLMKRIVERYYAKSELIFKQENPGVCLFIVKQGGAEISFCEENGDKTVYAVARPGSMFGELSVLFSSERTATAKATENNTALLTLSTFDFQELDEKLPQDGIKILKGITRTIVDNLIETTKRYQTTNLQMKEQTRKLEKYEAR